MKKFFILFLPLLTSKLLVAQFSLSMTNAPVAEKRYFFAKALVNNVNFVEEGANKVWDFSTMTLTGDSTNIYYTNDTNFVAFPQTPLIKLDTSFCNIRTLGLGIKVMSHRYSVGYEAVFYPLTGFMPSVVDYSILEFPFTYEDSIDASWAEGWTYASRYIKCDGYGELILPNISHNNLMRVHTYQSLTHDVTNGTPHDSYDTIYTDDFSWYAEHENMPILTIRTTWINSWQYGHKTTHADTAAKIYSRFENVISVPEVESDVKIMMVYPNPLDNMSQFFIKVKSSGTYNLKLVDIGGRIISESTKYLSSDTENRVNNFQGVKPGIYFVLCEQKGQVISQQKIIKM